MRNLMIKTHNDAMSLIKEAACGANVKIEKVIGSPGEDTSGMRRFYISLQNKTNPESCHIYALPFNEENMIKTIKTTLVSMSNRG
jgi:hypothetical protein